MSKRKRDVAFLKPEEPAFIARMKAEAGYKEGPTVDTKREALSFDDDSDDQDDEQPQVVVLKEGDLTAEEATQVQQEKEEGPADLAQRVVFKKPEKVKKSAVESSETSTADTSSAKNGRKEDNKETPKNSLSTVDSKKKSKSKSLLSFNDDEDEDT